jgi:hypothetical protein
MFHEGEHTAGHEPSRAHRRSTAGDLGDLHNPTPMSDLDPAADASCLDLVRLGRAAAGIDDDFDPIG